MQRCNLILLTCFACLPFIDVLLQLCDLYENDSIFDKFGCCMNGPATCFASGTYNNSFKVSKSVAVSHLCGKVTSTARPWQTRLQPAGVSVVIMLAGELLVCISRPSSCSGTLDSARLSGT
jgi:hypothetical protein